LNDINTALRASQASGVGYAYLEWLQREHHKDRLEAPPEKLDRVEQGRAIVAWGWSLWRELVQQTCGYDVGEGRRSLGEGSNGPGRVVGAAPRCGVVRT
jgi:hypothetical protein